MVGLHCAAGKQTNLGKIALEALALEHETDGELDDKMMIKYDDNEACGHDHQYHLYHSDDFHGV